MKAKVWKGVWALCVVAVTMASCDFVNKMKENATTTPSDTIIGANAGELDGKIDELLELAKAKKETAEFAEIYTYFNYKPGDPSTSVTIQIVTPEDKNKMAEYSWYDNKDVRNKLDKQDMVISDHDDNVIDTYDGFKDMLFTYDDVAKQVENLPVFCKEALEASGYGEDGYVRSYQIEKGDAFIMVGHKSSNMLSKTYHVAEDGEHIIVKESVRRFCSGIRCRLIFPKVPWQDLDMTADFLF
ncbi:MAG: hypothetical protein ACLRPS_10005 [Paraprevotella clara]